MLFAQVTFAETVYKGKDADGNVLFSDQPLPGSEKIEVQPAQTYTPPPLPNLNQDPNAKKTEGVISYKINIMAPQNEATMTNDIFEIPVLLSVEPNLQKGDKIRLLLNGKQYGPLYDAPNMIIKDLYRGTYQLIAEVISEADPSKIKGQSPAITFYQKRPIAGQAFLSSH